MRKNIRQFKINLWKQRWLWDGIFSRSQIPRPKSRGFGIYPGLFRIYSGFICSQKSRSQNPEISEIPRIRIFYLKSRGIFVKNSWIPFSKNPRDSEKSRKISKIKRNVKKSRKSKNVKKRKIPNRHPRFYFWVFRDSFFWSQKSHENKFCFC